MNQINHYCVYIHRNIMNNKAYIGITKYGDNPNKRWRNGNGYAECIHFDNAIQKYGWDNFEHIIWANDLSKDEAEHLENLLVKLFDTTNDYYGYNILPGGKDHTQTELIIYKRRMSFLETKRKNRIKESEIKFKERFDNGDPTIIRCEKCGLYFENKSKKSMGPTPSKGSRRKYCDECNKERERQFGRERIKKFRNKS